MSSPVTPTGVIEFFTHPPLKLLSPVYDHFGPYAGTVTLTQFLRGTGGSSSVHQVGDSGGVICTASTIPIDWTYNEGWRDEGDIYDEGVFEPALGQLIVQHQFLSGSWTTTQSIALLTFRTMVTWDYGVPARLGLYCQPFVEFDMYYLQTGIAAGLADAMQPPPVQGRLKRPLAGGSRGGPATSGPAA